MRPHGVGLAIDLECTFSVLELIALMPYTYEIHESCSERTKIKGPAASQHAASSNFPGCRPPVWQAHPHSPSAAFL